MRITPSTIELLMRLHYCERITQEPPFPLDEHLGWLLKHELIIPNSNFESGYTTSARGMAYVEAICHTPLPYETTVWRVAGVDYPG